MNRNINENRNIKYTLEDAYNIINSIINDEREKYENIINTMNNKINELKLEIEQLKEENKKYKNKIFQIQNQFYSLSKTFYQLNETPQKKFLKDNNLLFNLDNSQIINVNENSDLNNNIIHTDIINSKIKPKLNNSVKQQFFNKKLIKKINFFNFKKDKNSSKSFNDKINEPVKIPHGNKDNYNKQNYSQILNDLGDNYIKDLNNTIGNINSTNNKRKYFDNYEMQNYKIKKHNTQKEKFNIIERRIKNMKNGLSIYKSGRNRFNLDNSEYLRTKYDTYTINNKERRINLDIKDNNID